MDLTINCLSSGFPKNKIPQAVALSKNMDNDDWATTSNFMDIIEKKVGQNNDKHIC